MEQEVKDNSKIYIIIIAILLIIIFSGIAWNAGKNYANNEDKKVNTKIEENKEETVEDATLTEKDRQIIEEIMRYIPSKYTKVKANDFTNQEKLNIAFYLYQKETGWSNETITEKEIKDTMAKVLGSNTTYTDETIKSLYYPDETIAAYNKNKELYSYDSGSAHGLTAVLDYSYMDSMVVKGNKLTVTTYRVYYLYSDIGPITEIYKDFNMKNKIKIDKKYCEEIYDDDLCDIDVDKYILDNKDNVEKIEYIFDLNNNYPTFVEMK